MSHRDAAGHVVGGELRARHRITVREAGSENSASTLLSVADVEDRRAELVVLQQDDQRVRRRGAKLALAGVDAEGAKLTRTAMWTGDRLQRAQNELEKESARLLARAEIVVRGAACTHPHHVRRYDRAASRDLRGFARAAGAPLFRLLASRGLGLCSPAGSCPR